MNFEEEKYDKMNEYAEDHYNDLRLEYKLRNDYDDFVEYYSEVFDAYTEAYLELQRLHEAYGWEFVPNKCVL